MYLQEKSNILDYQWQEIWQVNSMVPSSTIGNNNCKILILTIKITHDESLYNAANDLGSRNYYMLFIYGKYSYFSF